jgi:hypothetical protein
VPGAGYGESKKPSAATAQMVEDAKKKEALDKQNAAALKKPSSE